MTESTKGTHKLPDSKLGTSTLSQDNVSYRYWVKKPGRGNFKKYEVPVPVSLFPDQVLIVESVIEL